MKHLKFNDYYKMPWKNGLGTTFQIHIHPENAELSKLNFDFRISMANISAKNCFSNFPNYKRILTVIDGTGITFNEKKLLKNEIIKFRGEDQITSKPINGNALDLGIIYNDKKVAVDFLYSDHIDKLDYDLRILIFLQDTQYQKINIIKYDSLIFEDKNESIEYSFNNFIWIGLKNLH